MRDYADVFEGLDKSKLKSFIVRLNPMSKAFVAATPGRHTKGGLLGLVKKGMRESDEATTEGWVFDDQESQLGFRVRIPNTPEAKQTFLRAVLWRNCIAEPEKK